MGEILREDPHSECDLVLLLLHCYLSESDDADDEWAVRSDQVLRTDHHNWSQSVLLLPHAVVQNPKLVLPAVCEQLLLRCNNRRLFLHSGADGGVYTHVQQIPAIHFLHLIPNRVLHVCSEPGKETLSAAVLHVRLDSCDPADCGDALPLNHSRPL